MDPRDGLATMGNYARFEHLENSTRRTIVVKGFPVSASIYQILETLGISPEDVQKTEKENKPEQVLLKKKTQCVIILKRAALAQQFMLKNRNRIFDGHKLKLTLKDTKTILKVDHHSVRISHLPPDISTQEIMDIITRDVGGVSIMEGGRPDIQFLFKFKKQTIMKITFDSAASADKCVERNGEPFSEHFPHVLKIRFFEIREKGSSKSKKSSKKKKLKSSKKKKSKSSANKKQKSANSDRGKYTVIPNVVFVRGFPKDFTEADLSKMVDTCGKVIRVVIYRDDKNVSKGAGAISFAQPADATSCIERFNRTLEWKKILRVTPFQSRVDYSNTENASKPGQSYECIICFETYDGKDVMNCVPIVRGLGNRETHFTCKDCVSGHAKALCSEGVVAQGGAGIPCGFPGCKRAILRAHLMRSLDDDTKLQLEKLMDKKALMNIRGLESCKSCDFGLILPNKWKMQFFHCENASCGAHFCRFCKIDFNVHIGKRCRDVEPGNRKEQERKKFEVALSEAVTRKCPKCHLVYQKIDGCNKITCTRCGTKQCYVCGESNIDYDHFEQSLGKCELFPYGTNLDEERLNVVRRDARQNQYLDGVEL